MISFIVYDFFCCDFLCVFSSQFLRFEHEYIENDLLSSVNIGHHEVADGS